MPHEHNRLCLVAPGLDQVRHVALAIGVVATAPIGGILEPPLHIHDNQSGASGHGLSLFARCRARRRTISTFSCDIVCSESPPASRLKGEADHAPDPEVVAAAARPRVGGGHPDVEEQEAATETYGNGSLLASDLKPGTLPSPDTPAQLLSKLTTVDGPGSGLDADTLGGVQSDGFLQG